MKKIALFAGVAVVVAGITAAVMVLVVLPKMSHSGGGAKVVVVTPTPQFVLGPTYTLQSRVVNLADPGSSRYLKVTIVLAFDPSKDTQADVNKKVAARDTVLEDALTTLLSSKTTDELSTADGKDQLKQEIKTRLATIFDDLHLQDVYFPDFVMQ